jgi:UDP-glucose 4-epimerase
MTRARANGRTDWPLTETPLSETVQSYDSHYRGRRVLVTGADGFIGSHLTERLARAGAEVTALCLYNAFDSRGWIDDLPEATRASISTVRGDVRDAAFMRRLMEGQAIVFHLAALIAIPHSYTAAQSYVDTNVTGTLNVLEAARDHNVARVVHTSTSEVYGTAVTVPITEAHPLQGQSPYSASKIGADMLAEAFARSFDLPVAVLRPFNTYGPRQSERAVIPTVVRQMLDQRCEVISIGDISPVRDFTYVLDTVAAFLAIGASSAIDFGRPYNSGTGRAVSIGEVIERLRELTGCSKPIRQDMARFRPPRSEVLELLADASAFSAATGWRPRISLEEGLSRTVAWWRERLNRSQVRPELSYAT